MNFNRDTQLSEKARAMLDALKILERETDPDGMTLEQARKHAAIIARRDRIHVVVGWDINDHTGMKQGCYGPLLSVSQGWLVMEPVEVIEPPEAKK